LNFNSLQIYPNPSSDYIYINETNIQQIKLFNYNGLEINLPFKSIDHRMDISTLVNGFYILKLQKNNTWYSFKLIKS
jgi:hypothetical protein